MVDIVQQTLGAAFSLAKAKKYTECLDLLLTADGEALRAKFKKVAHEAWYLVGDCWTQLAKHEKAINAFLEAYEARPGDIDTIFAIGNNFSSVGDFENAIMAFGFICIVMPEDAEARYNLGNAYFDAGEFEIAIRHFKLVKGGKKQLLAKVRKNLSLAKASLKKEKSPTKV